MSTSKSQCELCSYYIYDEDLEMYVCDVNLDQDEAETFYAGHNSCPYFHLNDEYAIVRKQN